MTELHILHMTMDDGEVVELIMRDEMKELMKTFEERIKKKTKRTDLPFELYRPMWNELKRIVSGKVQSRKMIKDLRKRNYIG